MLEKIGTLFSDTSELEMSLEEDGGQLGIITGIINTEKVNSFERMLWIASRGNVFVRRVDIEEAFEEPRTVRISLYSCCLFFFVKMHTSLL